MVEVLHDTVCGVVSDTVVGCIGRLLLGLPHIGSVYRTVRGVFYVQDTPVVVEGGLTFVIYQ